MQPYLNSAGNSGIKAYEIGDDYIKIQFVDEKYIYTYNYFKPGREHVKKMQALAVSGKGLATYINQNVRGDYAGRKKIN